MARRDGSDRKSGTRTRAWLGTLNFLLIFLVNFTIGAAQGLEPTPTLSIATLTVTPTVLHLVTKDDIVRWVNAGRDRVRGRRIDH